MPTPTQFIQALMAGLIDYAGLFPPAKLDMPAAVRNYASYLQGERAWILGRFVCPAARIPEFEQAAAGLMPDDPSLDPWRLSVLLTDDLPAELDLIHGFNERHLARTAGLAVIDAVEIKADSAAHIDRIIERLPDDVFPHFEIPVDRDPRGLIAALAGGDAAAKIRTGGVTPEAFPTVEQIARCIAACAAAETPFKATAGLHHALRAAYPLTYEKNSPEGIMHGFLNVFLAAAMIHAGALDASTAVELLRETSAAALRFEPASVTWRQKRLTAGAVAAARERFAISFGSCSFTEPIQEMESLGLL